MRAKSEPPPPPPRKPKKTAGYKYQLREPVGTILAQCPSRMAAVRSARAMYGEIRLKNEQGIWELYDTAGKLVALVTQ